ncbi:MAG: glycoside hydrolase family 3 C-terminal domain-containing protein [Bacteroidota bacterium]
MKLKPLILLSILFSMTMVSQESLPYKNTRLSIEERVLDLVSRMTLEEKISQLVYNSAAVERLHIPEYNWWNEALHGVARNGIATVFPQAIGLAATWDTSLLYKVSTVISDEARSKYNRAMKNNKSGIYEGITLWSPNVNIFRDPRWGRGMETYGEDPYLTGELGVQFIRGLQGNDPVYLKTIATPKHIAVHSGPEPDRHTFNAVVSDYDLRETYLAQFKKCVLEGKAYSVMCAYNRVRGEACCGSTLLERTILREEWGFTGLIVSDCWAVPDMYNYHRIVNSMEEAASTAVKAGTDLECGNSYPTLLKAVHDSLIREKEIDISLNRVLTARFKLGMFDPPEMVPYSQLNLIDTKENKQIALEAARKSIVLLKNEASILPLQKNVKTIAVLGPNANDVEVLLGNYNGFSSHPVTPLQGIIDKLKNARVIYERGCELAENVPSFEVIDGSVFYTARDKKQKGLTGEYFDNREFTGKPAFTRIDKNIDVAWWDGAPDKSFDPNNFGVRWSGIIVPQKTGTYTVGGYGFNGFRIYIEDTLFVKFDGEFDPVKTYETLNLTAGKSYSIKVEFYKKLRYSFMQLIWSIPDEHLEQKAIAAAKKADVVVMVMGLSPRLEGEEMRVELEGFKGGDRTSLDLPKTQSDFIKKIYSTGKPIVLVLLNGSAVALNWESENIPAIIEAWYPGQSAGTAIADVLFGDVNPSGRLPVTFYKSIDQLPAFSDYDMTNRTYRYFKGKPLYPFGYGLSYTSFKYKNLIADHNELSPKDSAVVSVEISNAGKVAGEEVIQLYVKAEHDTIAVKTLKGFQRVALNPGETKTVSFTVTPEKLSRWIDSKGFSVEQDRYSIMIGSSSSDKDLHKVEVVVKQ